MTTTKEPSEPVLAPKDLKPADVLLLRGEGTISRLIMRSDGGSYSHAALWSGAGVIEATGKGICETELSHEFDVYRPHGLSSEMAAKVVEAARASVGRRYAYTELLLLGVLFSVGCRPSRSLLAEIAARLGARGEFLKRWMDKMRSSETEPRVCSELVAASFDTAGAPLVILPRDARPALGGDDDTATPLDESESTDVGEEFVPSAEFDQLSQACTELFDLRPPTAETSGYEGLWTLLGGRVAVNSKDEPVALVTPGDLQFSTSLMYVGRVGKPLTDQLEAATAAANYEVARETADALTAGLEAGAAFALSDARRVLQALRRKKMFAPMIRFGEAFLKAGHDDPQVRRMIAQALIEQGRFAEAHAHLDRAKGADLEESYELIGVRARALKQEYFDGVAKGVKHDALLQKVVETYLQGYVAAPTENVWHGINAASCLRRAEKDGIAIKVDASARRIATELLDHIRTRSTPGAWELATAAEAALVLDRQEEALAWARRYVQHERADTFELSSTTRQLKQVLGLSEHGEGKELLELLNAENLKRSGGSAISRALGEADGASTVRKVPIVVRANDSNWAPDPALDVDIIARVGTVVTARASRAGIDALLVDDAVVAIEDSGPPIIAESVAVDVAGGEEGTDIPVEARHPSDGAIVAIIDSGVDVCHAAFRKADEKTRILAYWDQGDPTGPEPWPKAGGTVHWQHDIDQYLDTTKAMPPRLVRDETCHGTHVASIAAGSPFGSFPGGAAPQARIVVVATAAEFADGNPRSIGYSSAHVSALKFIGDVAKRERLPVVVNVSQGQNAGAHDGTSLLERAFESFCDYGAAPGRVIVKSAGNECTRQMHAKFTMKKGLVERLRWLPPQKSVGPHIVELWFPSLSELSVVLEFATEASQSVSPTCDKCVGEFTTGNQYELTYDRRLGDNGATRVRVVIEVGRAARIAYGEWRLRITGGAVVSPDPIHAWAERTGRDNIQFKNHTDSAYTLSIPGTAENIITVGAAEILPEGYLVGDFSSLGPTRRGGEKPDVVARGVRVIAAKGGSRNGTQLDQGTSMAAPAVAGAIAQVLTVRPNLNALQIRGMLRDSGGGSWHNASGCGLLNIEGLWTAAMSTKPKAPRPAPPSSEDSAKPV